MRRIALLIAIFMLFSFTAFGEDIIYAPDGWVFVGYPAGDVVFAVPETYVSREVSQESAAKGYVEIGGNSEFTLQVRAFEPESATYEEFVSRLTTERPVTLTEHEVDGVTVASYVRGDATAESELFGIVITGSDGRLYKLSIFAGGDGDISGDSKALEIGRIMAGTVRIWETDR